jgi:Flp pilus assembly protein TadB
MDGNANLADIPARARQEWVRANFTQIFGVSAEDLQAQGINPRRYAREHRDQIRQFAQEQRSQGIAVPTGRLSSAPRQVNPGSDPGEPVNRGYGDGARGRYGRGLRGGSAWIGILLFLFALRFLLVDSLVGARAAVVWVLMIGGLVLVARVLLFSWLRRRHFKRRR